MTDNIRFQDYADYASKKANHSGIAISEVVESDVLSKAFLGGKLIRQKISFTPYIYNKCSADCLFCSEKLIRDDSLLNDQYLSVSQNYQNKLHDILQELLDVDIFLSISGMEPLESLPFLEKVLTTFDEYERNGGVVTQKVIYSNLSAMANNASKIIALLQKHDISRVETSRHHYDEEVNDSIMQFRKKQAINCNANYERAVKEIQKYVPIKLACVVQQKGVNSIQEVVNYINWASDMRVTDITFRELSILGNHFIEDGSYEYIINNRKSILSLLDELTADFQLVEIVKGYYYFTFKYRYKGLINISFEVADYEEMIRCHTSSTIDKLIYYPNGDLCTDWNMQQKIY